MKECFGHGFTIPPISHAAVQVGNFISPGMSRDIPLYKFFYEPEPHKGFGTLHVFRMELQRGIYPGEEEIFKEIKKWCRQNFGRQQGVLPGRWRERNLGYVFTDQDDAFAFKMRWC